MTVTVRICLTGMWTKDDNRSVMPVCVPVATIGPVITMMVVLAVVSSIMLVEVPVVVSPLVTTILATMVFMMTVKVGMGITLHIPIIGGERRRTE